jgi:signal transduction histidine kinase
VQAEKMSSLGDLVAGLSHEINTPLYYLTSNATVVQDCLNSVKSFFDIAENMIAAVAARNNVKEVVTRGLLDMRNMLSEGMRDDVEEAQDLIQDSIEGLEEMTELAQSLKDFSRLDRAKHGEFNVNEGLDKTLLIAKNRIKNKVTVHKHYGDVPLIHCSPSQINQVFLNLITNAADAIESNGELVLRTWREVDKVCISFGDSGIGIPQDLLAKIRDPFFTTKEVGKGTGLGLSIVDQIVTAHHGELIFQSEPDRGTVVTVKLPIGQAKQQDRADAPRAEAATESGDMTDVADDVEAANEPGDAQDVDVDAEPEEVTA